MEHERVLVVSIDGVAPRFVTRSSMPHLCRLAQSGASCFDARTVTPSITLPAHASMLRGVPPAVHGILDNTPIDLAGVAPSFLRVARAAGRYTAALLNWRPIDTLVERDALDERWFLDRGYGADDDLELVRAAEAVLGSAPDVAFAYLVAPDNAGHAHGWGSAEYLESLRRADAALGRLLDVVGSDVAVLVTTDHGGHGHDHQAGRPVDRVTFVVLRSRRVEAGTCWPAASILDVAPTVAHLAGFRPDEAWNGTVLPGVERPIADHLLALVDGLVEHDYGEDLDMRAHSIQTANAVRSAGGTDELTLAGLLHDIGHPLGAAGAWGDPDHADIAAFHLQAWLPPAVVEPIRLHVAAKRYLVATDPGYADRLSIASTETLRQQGGAFTHPEVEAFESLAHAGAAVALRRADDQGKTSGLDASSVGAWRPLIERMVVGVDPDPRRLRDVCGCPECVDPVSGQRLLDPGDLEGWVAEGRYDGCWRLTHPDGRSHLVEPPAADRSGNDTTRAMRRPMVDPGRRTHDAVADLAGFLEDLVTSGLAVARGLGTTPGAVLEFARQLGHVRETNYGDLFDVRNVPLAPNLAYTARGIPLHTDNPYRDPVPTVQVLHCLCPAGTGGRSLFADGFAAAEALAAEAPQHFEVLATTPVTFRYRSADADLQAVRPIIELDLDGSVVGVALNHRSMVGPHQRKAEAFYDAYLAFNRRVEADDVVHPRLLRAGDVVAFDNRRVLHSRTGFRSDEPRHLQGCYVDIDAVQSAVRLASR